MFRCRVWFVVCGASLFVIPRTLLPSPHTVHSPARAPPVSRDDHIPVYVYVCVFVFHVIYVCVCSRGKAGLVNLGNTCFLNSAVQCLSHVQPLTQHILTNAYLPDVNKTNPMGVYLCVCVCVIMIRCIMDNEESRYG